jgi:ADP-heptose:LPS heptosyltransferase
MNKSRIKLYFPRWIFPNNLGDSLVCTFVPGILKKKYPNTVLEIITYGFLIDLFKLDNNVDIVREPNGEELYLNFKQYAFSD